MTVKQARFYLNISAERYLRYYQGAARSVSVVTVEGLRVKFPAAHLRPFVTHDGVMGEFILRFDNNHKFVGLERIGDLPKRR